MLTIWLDLGEEVEFNEVKIHLLDSSSDGTKMTTSAIVLANKSQPILSRSGFNSNPPINDIVWFNNLYTSSNSGKAQTLSATSNSSTTARYLTLELSGIYWLFISEIELFNNSNKVNIPLATSSYHPTPSSTSSNQEYPDNGRMITDGIISGYYNLNAVGARQPLQFVIDLGTVDTPVEQVDCYTIDDENSGIYPPRNIKLEISNDSKNWDTIKTFSPINQTFTTSSTRKNSMVHLDQAGRYLRVTITPSQGWCFASEIAVY